MGNWIPHDPTLVAQILKISSACSPPPLEGFVSPPPLEGFVSPMTWGIESNVIERFAGAGVPKEKISFVRDSYTFNFPGTHWSSLLHSENTRADHECVRSSGKEEWSRR
jgi:hypothetical protein